MLSINRTLLTFVIVAFSLSAKSQMFFDKLQKAATTKDSVKIYLDLSEQYRFSRPEKGLSIAQKALDLSRKVNDTILQVESGVKLALLQKENSLYSTALATILNASELSESTKDKDLIANCNLVTAHIYSNLRDKEKATEYYEMALTYYKIINDSSGLGYTYSGLGIVYYDSSELDLALKYYLNAEKFWPNNELSLKADLWNNIGALYQELRDFKKAEKYYNKALIFYQEEGWDADVSMVYYNLGEMFLLQANNSNARYYFNKSLEIGNKIGSPTEKMWAYYGLYMAEKEANKLEQALTFYEKHINLKDSIDDIQNKRDVRELEAKFNKEKQLKKIKEQKLEILEAEKKAQSQRSKIWFTLFFVFLFAVLLGVAIMFIRKSRKHNFKLEESKKIIESSLKEKELLLKEIHHRVKNNLQVISSLLNLQRHKVNDANTTAVIEDTQTRIKAIALVHQKLYQSENIGQVDISSYLKELIDQEYSIYRNTAQDLEISIDVPQEALIDLDTSVSLGLIISELLTNAFKYAFNENKKKHELKLTLTKNNENYSLMLRDNGPGIPEKYMNGKKDSLGMDLVEILTSQIDGKLIRKNDNGACFIIEF